MIKQLPEIRKYAGKPGVFILPFFWFTLIMQRGRFNASFYGNICKSVGSVCIPPGRFQICRKFQIICSTGIGKLIATLLQ